MYQPSQKITVDERMIKSKGRVLFKQYMPKKPTKWGRKVFAVCDSTTSYYWDFDIYRGQAVPGQQDHGLTMAVVLRLMEHFHNQGYICFTDNYYTSPALALALMERGIHLIGTCKKDR